MTQLGVSPGKRPPRPTKNSTVQKRSLIEKTGAHHTILLLRTLTHTSPSQTPKIHKTTRHCSVNPTAHPLRDSSQQASRRKAKKKPQARPTYMNKTREIETSKQPTRRPPGSLQIRRVRSGGTARRPPSAPDKRRVGEQRTKENGQEEGRSRDTRQSDTPGSLAQGRLEERHRCGGTKWRPAGCSKTEVGKGGRGKDKNKKGD